jgi:hypothetical protein
MLYVFTLQNVSTASFSPQKDLLYPWCRQDELMMDMAVLYGMRCLITKGSVVEERLVRKQQADVYGKINRRLAMECYRPSWGLLAALFGLICGLKETKDPFEESSEREYMYHLNGVKALICAAGGWATIVNFFDGFTWHLAWSHTQPAP